MEYSLIWKIHFAETPDCIELKQLGKREFVCKSMNLRIKRRLMKLIETNQTQAILEPLQVFSNGRLPRLATMQSL